MAMRLLSPRPTAFLAEAVAPPRPGAAPARPSRRGLLAAACACCAAGAFGAAAQPRGTAATVAPGPVRPVHARLDAAARAVEPRMIAWRRDIHQNPELG